MFPNDAFRSICTTRPTRSLFASDKRAFSHGCVRVDNPFALRRPGARPGVDDGTPEEALIGSGGRIDQLPQPLPIHPLVYNTIVVGAGRQDHPLRPTIPRPPSPGCGGRSQIERWVGGHGADSARHIPPLSARHAISTMHREFAIHHFLHCFWRPVNASPSFHLFTFPPGTVGTPGDRSSRLGQNGRNAGFARPGSATDRAARRPSADEDWERPSTVTTSMPSKVFNRGGQGGRAYGCHAQLQRHRQLHEGTLPRHHHP